jgi:ankyrin repeat protein
VRGDVDGVREALEAGADVVNCNWVPLAEVCKKREFSLPIAEILIENGARVNKKNGWGITPLMFLGESGNCTVQTLNLFLNAGADINAEDNKGRTFLWYAVKHFDPDVFELAIRRGADINHRDKDRGTILLYYYTWQNFSTAADMARFFVKHGVDFYARDDKGQGLLSFIGENKLYRTYIDLFIQGDKETEHCFFDIIDKLEPKEIFSLIRLALLYPEENQELEKEVSKKKTFAFRYLVNIIPDAPRSFWCNVLAVVSKGRRGLMKIKPLRKDRTDIRKHLVNILNDNVNQSPEIVLDFISKRLGGECLKQWESDGVPGASDLNVRLSTILRERIDTMETQTPEYVL